MAFASPVIAVAGRQDRIVGSPTRFGAMRHYPRDLSERLSHANSGVICANRRPMTVRRNRRWWSPNLTRSCVGVGANNGEVEAPLDEVAGGVHEWPGLFVVVQLV